MNNFLKKLFKHQLILRKNPDVHIEFA